MANCFMLENIKSLMDKGGVIGAVFMDFKKAFWNRKSWDFTVVNYRITFKCFNWGRYVV